MERDERNEQEHNEIARRAHERFEERGREHGADQEDWYEAEREISENQRSTENEEPGNR